MVIAGSLWSELGLIERPRNEFDYATAIIATVSMAEEPFEGISDAESIQALTALESRTFNVVRAANELFWCREKAWKTYRLSSQDVSGRLGLRPSDQIEVHWWAFVNYIYQFEEKVKLYLNCYNAFAPFLELSPIVDPGKIVRGVTKRLRKFTEFRHESTHKSYYPPNVMGQLPLVEFLQENHGLSRRLPGTEYLDIPPKILFRITRHGMHSEMEIAMAEMRAVAEEIASPHKQTILLACYKVTSYTQWAKAGQARFKFGP